MKTDPAANLHPSGFQVSRCNAGLVTSHMLQSHPHSGAKTVLYVHPTDGGGGADTSLFVLLDSLDRDRYRPIIAGPYETKVLKADADDRGIPFYPLYLAPWAKSHVTWREFVHIPNQLNTIRRLLRIMSRENVSLVHSNLIITLAGALAANVGERPHISHIRDEIASSDYYQFFGGVDTGARIIAALSDQVVAVSDCTARPFFRVGSQAETVPNATRLPPLDSLPDGSIVRKQLGIPDDATVVGIIGQVILRKGHEELLEAVRLLELRHHELHLIIVGSFYNGFETSIQKRTELLREPNRVHIVGQQSEIYRFIRAMDILACPSRAEGFGRVVIEAMACERPVVGTLVGGIPEIIEEGITGYLVPPQNPVELAKAIEKLLCNQALAHEMGIAGRRRAESEYTPEVHAGRIMALYDRLLGYK